jgi:hypothetical protein
MKPDKVKIKLYIGTGYAGCDHTDYEYVDRSEWETMTEKERDAYLDEAANTHLQNNIEYSAYVVES